MSKIWERFASAAEAEYARTHEQIIMSVTLATLTWLYMDDVPGESRLDYLKRLRDAHILKAAGFAEIKALERSKRNDYV